jgi:hypothetical protein
MDTIASLRDRALSAASTAKFARDKALDAATPSERASLRDIADRAESTSAVAFFALQRARASA